jgi:integrase
VPSLSITVRKTKSGERRYVVRFRLGGRAYPIEHGGSFRTLREARARRDFVAGELAAGRNPRLALNALLQPEQPRRSYTSWHDAFVASRLDVSPGTLLGYRGQRQRLVGLVGDRDPLALTPADCREIVASLAADMKPGSVEKWFTTFRLVLDFAGAEPNPARHRTIKLPSALREEAAPPTDKHYLAILAAMKPERHRLPVVLIEQTAMRIGEVLEATWGDVDVAGSQIRLRRATTKTKTARWVQVPEWLMDILVDTCPFEDRLAARRLFPGLTEGMARKAITRACQASGVPPLPPSRLQAPPRFALARPGSPRGRVG